MKKEAVIAEEIKRTRYIIDTLETEHILIKSIDGRDLTTELKAMVAELEPMMAKRIARRIAVTARLRDLNDMFMASLEIKGGRVDLLHFGSMAERAVELTPPKTADLLICWVLPKKDWDEVLGDLNEGYYKLVKQFGPSWAKQLYWWHAARSMGYFIVCRVYNAFEKVWKLGSGK